MRQYLTLLKDVIENGEDRKDRTKIGTRSIFGREMRFDLSKGFPLLTTKKLHVPSIVHELLWFLKGTESTEYLRENNITIWEEWAKEDGTVGPMYGVQWRNWNGIDQIQKCIDEIKTNPTSRRLIVSAWNVSALEDMVLSPCHAFFQFYVTTDFKLHLKLTQRSADIFLGVPYNIASYALLLHFVSMLTKLSPGELIWSGGDIHLYSNHFEQAVTQLNRKPKQLPIFVWEGWPLPDNINNIMVEDFSIAGYETHPHIKAKVAV